MKKLIILNNFFIHMNLVYEVLILIMRQQVFEVVGTDRSDLTALSLELKTLFEIDEQTANDIENEIFFPIVLFSDDKEAEKAWDIFEKQLNKLTPKDSRNIVVFDKKECLN